MCMSIVGVAILCGVFYCRLTTKPNIKIKMQIAMGRDKQTFSEPFIQFELGNGNQKYLPIKPERTMAPVARKHSG